MPPKRSEGAIYIDRSYDAMKQHACEIINSIYTIRVMICDDIAEQLDKLAAVVREAVKGSIQNLIVETYTNPIVLLERISEYKKENSTSDEIVIVMADIRMPDMDGITLGKKLRAEMPGAYLVFTTAFSEYAIKGYEAQAFRYLLKPVTTEKIRNIINEIFKLEGKNKKLVIHESDKEYVLPLNNIIYFSAEDKYVVIHTKESECLVRRSLQDYETLLFSYGFYRIHRKYLVNIMHHKCIKNGLVLMDNGDSLVISRRKVNSYRERVFEILSEGYINDGMD
ncbi:MAG: LytR/AlgR family response regulator transcription factor [Coprococcus sp.]